MLNRLFHAYQQRQNHLGGFFDFFDLCQSPLKVTLIVKLNRLNAMVMHQFMWLHQDVELGVVQVFRLPHLIVPFSKPACVVIRQFMCIQTLASNNHVGQALFPKHMVRLRQFHNLSR